MPSTTHGGKLQVPVAVLVGDVTASSAEATMLAFRDLDYSQSSGSPIVGYASVNLVVNTYDGAGLMITTAKDRDRTGQEHFDDPVQPDVETQTPEEDATAWLEQQCS